jgi:hypothetical protein
MKIKPTIGAALNFISRFPTAKLAPVRRLSKAPPLIRNNLADGSGSEWRLRKWHAWQPGCNWSVSLNASGIIAVDTDVKPGKVGRTSWDWLDIDHGWPPTARASTPSGGWHDYYLGPHTFALGFAPDIDSPNYTIIPGCSVRAKDGSVGSYRWMNNLPAVDAPQWLLDALAAKQSEALIQDVSEAVIDLDLPGNVLCATIYLKTEAPRSIMGQGGERTLLQVAMRLRDIGISFETAVDLIFTHYNTDEHCDPVWEGEELIQKVRNGYTYANKRRIGEGSALFEFGHDDFDPATYQRSRPTRRLDKKQRLALKRSEAMNALRNRT